MKNNVRKKINIEKNNLHCCVHPRVLTHVRNREINSRTNKILNRHPQHCDQPSTVP